MSVSNSPLVSVCIPSHNNVAFVGEAVQSALSQTHPNIEVIVVDDGSSDESVEVLRSFGKQIVFEATPNRGACAARNRAFELSHGKYIQFLDADDRLVPEKIARQLPFLESGEADLVFCKGFLFGDGKPMRPKKSRITSPAGMDPFAFCLVQGLSTEGPLHRRENVEQIGGFRVGLKRAQELDFHLRLGAIGTRIHLLDELLYEHRHHEGPRITRLPIEPDYMVNLLRELSLILETPPYNFTAERRMALAGQLFQHAIYAYRAGATSAADAGFTRARSLAKRFDYHERRVYKVLTKIVGPMPVEKALQTARRVTSKAPKTGG